MEIVEAYCPICEKIHEVEYHTRITNIDGVESSEEFFICPVATDSDNEFITMEQFKRNLSRHKKAREKEGLRVDLFSRTNGGNDVMDAYFASQLGLLRH